MYKMLAVVFNDEKSAYEGVRALKELNSEGSIDVFAGAVLQKDAQGWVATKKVDSDFPIQTFAGTAMGALIGLLGGPAGVAVGSAAGVAAGLLLLGFQLIELGAGIRGGLRPLFVLER